MVKKISKFLAYSAFFIVALMYFTPKTSIYYFLETQLHPHGIVINSESLEDSGFTLQIRHAYVFFKSIESANVLETNVTIFALYNTINFKNIILSSAAKSLVPLHVQRADVKYTILDPLNVNAKIEGDFGEANIKFNILQNAIHVKLMPSDLMLKSYKNTLDNMSKDKNGEYVYDKNL